MTTVNTTTSFTEKEIEFLNKMRESDYYENGIDSILWDFSVNDELSYKGKTRSGVVSSLAQKGIISVYRKEKGDNAGTYALTDEAKNNPEILAIFTR